MLNCADGIICTSVEQVHEKRRYAVFTIRWLMKDIKRYRLEGGLVPIAKQRGKFVSGGCLVMWFEPR
jgi:hypothetical protein